MKLDINKINYKFDEKTMKIYENEIWYNVKCRSRR